jgi:hypothetical protein
VRSTVSVALGGLGLEALGGGEDLGPHRLQAAHVVVDGTGADAVATDEGHERLAHPVQQGPDQQDGDAVQAAVGDRHPAGVE